MKKKLAEIILPVFVTVLFTFIVQYVTILLSQPNGVYEISTFSGDSESFGIIQLDNRSKIAQNDFVFLVDRVDDMVIESSDYADYSVVKSKTDTAMCLLTISSILPKTKTKLILKGLKKETKISFSNVEAKKFMSSDELINRQLNSFRNAIITTLIYGLIFGLFYIYFMYRVNQNVEIRNTELKDLRKRTKSIEKKIKESQKTSMKSRLLLMAKIRDYEKELSFWKTTVSKILLKDAAINSKQLFKSITDNLKTYGTRESIDEQLTMAEYLEKITNHD